MYEDRNALKYRREEDRGKRNERREFFTLVVEWGWKSLTETERKRNSIGR